MTRNVSNFINHMTMDVLLKSTFSTGKTKLIRFTNYGVNPVSVNPLVAN